MHNKVPKNEYLKGKPGKKKDAFKKDRVIYDQKSMMGYRDDSPYRQLPFIDINTPNGYIDMSYTGMPLFANGQYLPPYSGQHFMGTNVVRETPVWDKGFNISPPPGHIDFIDKGFDIPSKTTARYYPGHPEYFQQGGDPSIPELNQAKKGGWLNKYQDGAETQGMTGSMKGAIAYGYMYGNPAAQRMVNPYTNPYIWTGNEPGAGVPAGNTGTHFMASMDNYAVPFIQQGPNGLYYNEMANPSNPEAFQFNTPEEAEYFAEHYKDVAPAFQKKGGNINKYSKMPKKKSSKNIKTSINKLMVKNPLFERNYMLYGAKGPRLYDPSSKYQMGGWLDNYQDGGTPIHYTSEAEYQKGLLNKNKSAAQLAAEKEWAAKKVAAANKAKAQQTNAFPSSEQQAQLFGVKPVAAESTGITPTVVYNPEVKPVYNPNVGLNPRVAAQNKIIQEKGEKRNYAIVDKNVDSLFVFNPAGQLISGEPVITGASRNDIDKGLSMKEWMETTGDTNHDHYFDYLKSIRAQTTPAGAFYIGSKRNNVAQNPDIIGNAYNQIFRPERAEQIYSNRIRDYGPQQTLFTLVDQYGVPSSKALHGTANPVRVDAFNTPGTDRHLSNGCINLNGQTVCFDELGRKSHVFILPEESNDLIYNYSFPSNRKYGGWLNNYQTGGGAGKPIYVSSPLDPRYQAYSDSLSLYNNYKKRVDTKGGTLRGTFAIDDDHFTPGAIYNETDRIKPTGIEWHEGGYGRSGDTFIPAYKKPVQQVVVKKVVKKTPEQKARELKPIESKLTPMEVAPEPALYKAPTRQPLYKKTQAPNMPPFYWQFDPVAKQWYQISESAYTNAPAEQKKRGGNIGGLNNYQTGGVTINSEEEYQKSLLMKNKTKERMDAESAWAAKKVAVANAKKAQLPAPSPQQLFGIQPVVAESTGVNKTPQAGLDLKNKTALSFHKAVKDRVKANPNLSIEEAQSQLNREWLIANGKAYGQGVIRQSDPEQGILSKTIEVASHPFNALDAYVQSGYVPDYFSHNKDAVNPMDIAYGFTPAGWYTQGADALYNDLPTDIEQGNWPGVLEDMLMILPLAQRVRPYIPRGYKPVEVPTQLPGSPNTGYKFPKYSLQSAESQVGIDPVHYRAVDAVKNNSDSYYNFVTETFQPGVKKSSLVNPQFGYDYVLPEGMGIDELNEFARRNQAGLIEPYQVNDVYESIVKLNPELKKVNINKKDLIHGVASHVAPQDLINLGDKITPPKGFFGNLKAGYQETKWKQFTDKNEGFDFRFSPERQKEIMRTYKPTNTPAQLPGSPNNIVPKTPPNPALGNPIGTTDDIRRSLIPESEYLFPSEYSKRGVPFSSFRPEAGGYTDIPQFNQQIQGFNTQMQFGKRPLETQINVRPQTQNLLANQALLESQGNVPQYYYNTPVYPGFSTLERRPLTGYQMFQQIQPNKYGGTPRKSDKKLVNYSQNPNFVKTQSTSWLDKYQ